MIDLSFLTEEEQETILAVLKRDTELKKAEEQRVQSLQKTVTDKGQLKYMTGEWFYETKQLRHQDRIHGSDIIRASMSHTYKPLTILELSQILPEKPSFVSSENKEVFVPPVLRGVLQEPHRQLSNEKYQNQNPHETPQDARTPLFQSPTKQRKNPFNCEVMASHTVEEKGRQLLDKTVNQTQTQKEEPFPPPDHCISYASDLKQNSNDSLFTQNTSVPMLMPEYGAVSTRSQDCFVDVDRPGDTQTSSVAPRGILKHLSTSSSTDSLLSRLELQSPVSLDSPTETWIERKQVRFSSIVGWTEVEWQDGKELGEHSLLDIDSITPSKAGNNSDLENTGSTSLGTCRLLLIQSQVDSQEGELICKNEAHIQEQEAGQHQVLCDVSDHCHSEFLSPTVSGLVSAEQETGKQESHLETKPEEDRHSETKATDWPAGHNIHQQKLPEHSTDNSLKATSDTKLSTNCSSKGSSHVVSPKPRQRLLGIFKKDKEKTAGVQSPQKEEVNISKQKEPGNTQNLSQGAADTTVDSPASVRQEAPPSELTEVRTLQLTALQNTPFMETVALVDADTQQEATGGRVVQLPERLSNLKAFWERENSGPKIIFTREEARHKDITKIGIEASQNNCDVVSINNNLSPQMTMTAGRSQEKSSSQTVYSLLVDVSKEDGTYRANPVLICDETDDSLTGSVTESQISEPQENITTPVSFSVAFNTQRQEGDIPVPLPRQSSSSPPEDRPARLSDLKNFWEKEYTGPRVIAARVKEASSSSVLNQPDPRTSLDSREKFDAQLSPYKNRSNVVSKSSKVTDKGFVRQSPDKSHLRSSDSSGDVQSTCHQSQVKADRESQERPLSPSKCQSPRSKDQDDEVRRSPSKTCHPSVLPRESSSPKISRLEGSPLKTFPIDINPQTKVDEEQQGKLTPVPRQRKSPSYEAKQKVLIDTKPSKDIISCLLPLHLEDSRTYFGNVNTQQSSLNSPSSSQTEKASGKKLGPFTRLARSFIPQDFQHYLGPQEKAHVPQFHQEKAAAAAAEDHVVHRPQSALREFVGNQSDSPTEGNPPRISSWIVHNKDGNSSRDISTTAWSRASSGSSDETSSPIMSALKPLSSRSISSSKSLENLTSQTREQRTQNYSTEQINQSVDEAFIRSSSKQMKSSVSVPVLQLDETDSDSPIETNLGLRRNTGSSMSNLSLSSGMASMSSVSGSISSIYPADCGDIEVQGNIQFAVNYIQKLGEFHIFVVHCRTLAVADTKKTRSDPYVKCYLLPDKTKLGKRKTTVKKKTLNPTYNEILKFKITMEVLKTQNLNISVWHNDTFRRNSFLGEVNLDLSEWDFSNTQINEYALKTRVFQVSAQTATLSLSRLIDNRGQMRVALRFLPQTSDSKRTSRTETGEVQIWVKDCKNLPPVRGVTIDPFVKCNVLPDKSQKSRQKTRVVKRTANPMFNHTMVYDGFRPEDLREACVEITVWDHDRLNNHFIGGLRLGLGTGKSYGVEVVWMDSTADEANLWQRMLQCDGEWVEDVLPLRMLVVAKSMSK
ncbi:synaptotagmin-like protein 2 isoform X1 [Micropterus salmoides]|uniref:synaptotagmin-like protein 2 isoform X1 n=2 Tax=Micropterus salmoides TaxID=27706 RepID=UPI0018ED3BC6|nr:synaptotagmin-like protein 2 isoform X1 [Micropterus salmoides]XP_038565338.1 synaptotagmin-like protein 2 isoform X1 [Micropterus salmoides]